MRLFGRRKPLHWELADAAGIAFGPDVGAPPGLAAQPPGWDGEQRGEPGIHGVPRARRWEAVVVAAGPDLDADAVHFVALPDGTLIVEEDVPDGALAPLADAVETRLPPPYRAEAVRRRDGWAVGARRIAVVVERGLPGDEAELVVTSSDRSLTVDGHRYVAHAPGLQLAAEAQGLGAEYVLRATRLDGDLWEVETSAL